MMVIINCQYICFLATECYLLESSLAVTLLLTIEANFLCHLCLLNLFCHFDHAYFLHCHWIFVRKCYHHWCSCFLCLMIWCLLLPLLLLKPRDNYPSGQLLKHKFITGEFRESVENWQHCLRMATNKMSNIMCHLMQQSVIQACSGHI